MTWVVIMVCVAIATGLVGGIAQKAKGRPNRTPSRAPIDAFTVQEPWRRYVQSAVSSRNKLEAAIDTRADGPTKDRLHDALRQVNDIVARIWEVAQEGHTLGKATRLTELPALERRMQAAEADLASTPPDRQAAGEASLASLRSSVEAARRIGAERDRTADQLRELDAQLDEVVVRSIELSTSNVDPSAADELRASMDAMVVELEGLRQGLQETKRVATA
jgi:hypothetical protein